MSFTEIQIEVCIIMNLIISHETYLWSQKKNSQKVRILFEASRSITYTWISVFSQTQKKSSQYKYRDKFQNYFLQYNVGIKQLNGYHKIMESRQFQLNDWK